VCQDEPRVECWLGSQARLEAQSPSVRAEFTRQVTSRAAAGGTTLVAGAAGTAAALGAPLGGLSKVVSSSDWAARLAIALVVIGIAYEAMLFMVGKNLSSAREWLASPSSLREVVLGFLAQQLGDGVPGARKTFGRSEFVRNLREKLDSQHLSPARGFIGKAHPKLNKSQLWWSFVAWLTGTYISPDRLDEAADAGLDLFIARGLIVKMGARNLDERYMIVDKLNADTLGVSPTAPSS
jgi:hypothetical protein